MKTKTVAILGRSRIDNYREFIVKLKKVFCTLIEEENAETFLFIGGGSLNYTCHYALTKLKEKFYPLIKRVYVTASTEKSAEKIKEYLLRYDEVYNPYGAKQGGYYATAKRNLIMVDMCDILITFFDKDYRKLQGVLSETKANVERAITKNKRVINLYEY